MEEKGLILSLYTEDSNYIGTHEVYLWCMLNDYPSVKDYAIITVTIEPCVMLEWALAG